MATKYRASCNGYAMGAFEPIRFADGRIGYQATDSDGRLLGILWSDGRYGDAHRNGNTTWELCEETPAHRRILKLAAAPWEMCPLEFSAL